jgi:SET domain-containing protein
VKGDTNLAKFLKKAIGIFYTLNTKPSSNHAQALCFGGLLNHSCIPNVEVVSVDDKVAYYVVRPIKAGEQLFVSYVTYGR